MARYLTGLVVAVISFLGVTLGIVALMLMSLPNVSKLRGCLTTEMFKVRLCPGENTYTPLRQISPQMIGALIISEDAAFYHHGGFDFDEIKASLTRNFERGEFARGGSTISQQLVKNVFLTPEKSLLRKLKEALLTYELERGFKKNEILERYLNVVEFGPKLYGIRQASSYYFNKAPAQLNALESAFLVSLLPNPKKYSASHRARKLTPFMRKRVLTIVGKLQATGRLSAAEASLARENVDAFPWKGLGNSSGSSEQSLESLEKTDWSSGGSIEPEPEVELQLPPAQRVETLSDTEAIPPEEEDAVSGEDGNQDSAL